MCYRSDLCYPSPSPSEILRVSSVDIPLANDGGVPSLLLRASPKDRNYFSSLYLTVFSSSLSFLILPFHLVFFLYPLRPFLRPFAVSPRGEDPQYIADATVGITYSGVLSLRFYTSSSVYIPIYPDTHSYIFDLYIKTYRLLPSCVGLRSRVSGPVLRIPPLAANFLPEYFLVPTRETSSSRLVSLN